VVGSTQASIAGAMVSLSGARGFVLCKLPPRCLRNREKNTLLAETARGAGARLRERGVGRTHPARCFRPISPSTPSCIISAASAGVAIPPAAKLTTGRRPVLATSWTRENGAWMCFANTNSSSSSMAATWRQRIIIIRAASRGETERRSARRWRRTRLRNGNAPKDAGL